MEHRAQQRTPTAWRAVAWVLVMVGVVLATPPVAPAGDTSEAKGIVHDADTTLKNFLTDPDMKWFKANLKNARAVYILPKVLKGAFIFGVEGGNGVVLTRDDQTGAWSEPAFFETSAASFGLQAGAQSQETIMLVMTPKGVESLLTSTVKLGADGSVAIGPKGIGAEGATAPNLNTDFVTFSRAKGLFAGLSFDGAVVRTRDELNSALYGPNVRPKDVFITRTVPSNPSSKELHQTLAMAVSE